MNIAARLQTVADPGSICISEAVYQQVYTKVDLAFEDLGVRELRNIEHPIRLYRVITPRTGRAGVPAEAPAQVRPPGRSPQPPRGIPPRGIPWTEALLHSSGKSQPGNPR